jgi:hypothetical protein
VGRSQTPASEGWKSVLDYAREQGHDVTGHQDDQAFIRHLLNVANTRRQEDVYSQIGRQFANRQLAEQQKAAQPQATAGPQPWEAPKFDRRWMGLVEYNDQAGMFIGKPGAPANIVDAVNNYHEWSEKFGSNPIAAVQPYVDKQVPDLVQAKVQEALAQYKTEQAVQHIVSQNSDWVYQKDQFGQPVMGPNGRPVPTPNGLSYGRYVNELERSGMRDPYQIDRYAKAQVQADLNLAAQRQQQQAAPNAQVQNATNQGRPQQNVRQSRGPLDAPANEPAPHQEDMTLADRLRTNLDAAGFGTDSDFKFGDY